MGPLPFFPSDFACKSADHLFNSPPDKPAGDQTVEEKNFEILPMEENEPPAFSGIVKPDPPQRALGMKKAQALFDHLDKSLGRSSEKTTRAKQEIKLAALFENIDRIKLKPSPFKQKKALQNPGGLHKIHASFIATPSHTFGITNYLLGKGASKTVKAVVDLETSTLFARATAPHTKGENTSNHAHWIRLNQLKNEIRIHQKFQGHKEFIQIVHSSYFLNGRNLLKHSLIMEYADATLQGLIEASKSSATLSKQESNQFITIFHDVLLGLSKMQTENTIHRDIKPHNVLVTRSKGRLNGKITDFGFAIDPETSLGICCTTQGTPAYMSPEVLIGASPTLSQKKKEACLTQIASINKRLCDIRATCQEAEAKGEDDFPLDIFKTMEKSLILSREKQTDLLDSYNGLSHIKSDVWAYGVMIFKLLFKKSFYFYANPKIEKETCTLEMLVGQAFILTQTAVNSKLNKIFTTKFEERMHFLLKQILIVERPDRPDAKRLYALYCKVFELDPQNMCTQEY